MPLPAALAARLAKRGIVTKAQEPEEEVIAEDYDNVRTHDDSRIDEFGNILIENWEKVWDSEWETWYYWDTISGLVSWLPPGDPEAVITYPASKNPDTANIPMPEPKKDEQKRGTKGKDKSRGRQVRWQKSKAEDEVDPMDPSSYSDAPVGDWKRGLKKLNDAKTGVDSTATGPLFQQRPYPSPGEVLKRNKQVTTGPQMPS